MRHSTWWHLGDPVAEKQVAKYQYPGLTSWQGLAWSCEILGGSCQGLARIFPDLVGDLNKVFNLGLHYFLKWSIMWLIPGSVMWHWYVVGKMKDLASEWSVKWNVWSVTLALKDFEWLIRSIVWWVHHQLTAMEEHQSSYWEPRVQNTGWANIQDEEWSMSNFPCSLTRNITSHSMENLAFHHLLRLKMIKVQMLNLTTSWYWCMYSMNSDFITRMWYLTFNKSISFRQSCLALWSIQRSGNKWKH